MDVAMYAGPSAPFSEALEFLDQLEYVPAQRDPRRAHVFAWQAQRQASRSISVLSRHAIKCLTTGEGGMAVSNDPDVLGKMRRFRDRIEAATAARIGSPMPHRTTPAWQKSRTSRTV
jgi:dTDP-4-amino-4,6-dideoxygalactose transaminase